MRNLHRRDLILLVPMLMFLNADVSRGQRGLTPPVSRTGNFSISGDLDVTEKDAEDKVLTFDVMLYSRTGVVIDRQRVGSKGRFRFNNVSLGDYDIVVQFENTEVWREHVKLTGVATDFRQNIAFELRLGFPATPTPKPATISAEDAYERHAPNKDRFEKAQEAFDRKEYDKAITLFAQIVADDPQDFQAWSELGTVYLVQKNFAEAEKSYLRSTEVRPTFFRALFNLGRVRLMQKNFEGAITALDQAVTVQPKSAEANYFLGEAYLQIKKGSKAVGYLYEALKLDPSGMAEAHLRLALLYHGAGMKDKAAAEYEEFLKKKPDYPDRKKLEKYIAENKKK
jgi:cytochrome c-type biogenesis protein CcmH/NrfG